MELKVQLGSLRSDLAKEIKEKTKKIADDYTMHNFLNKQNKKAIEDAQRKFESPDNDYIKFIINKLKIADKLINQMIAEFQDQSTKSIFSILKKYAELNHTFAEMIEHIGSVQDHPPTLYISYYISGHRKILTDENITTDMIKIDEVKNNLTLLLNSGLKNFEELSRKPILDEQIDQHYRQFNNFMNLYYVEHITQGGFFGLAKKVDNNFKQNEKQLGHTWKEYKAHQWLLVDIANMDYWSDEQQLQFILLVKQRTENYGVQLNQGNIAEAFERHLEEHHGFIQGGYPSGVESIAFQDFPDEPIKAWTKHILESKGDWPSYFGADTQFSQVKSNIQGDKSLAIISVKKLVGAQIYIRQFLNIINNNEVDKTKFILEDYIRKLENNYKVGERQVEEIKKRINEI